MDLASRSGEFWLAVALIGFLGLCVCAALVAFLVNSRRSRDRYDEDDDPPTIPMRRA